MTFDSFKRLASCYDQFVVAADQQGFSRDERDYFLLDILSKCDDDQAISSLERWYRGWHDVEDEDDDTERDQSSE